MKKKLLAIALMSTLLCGHALAELTRDQEIARVNQVLDTWQKSGKVWQGRLEDGDALGVAYMQYPGKLYFNWPGQQNDLRVADGKTVKRGNGQEESFTDWGLWILTSGQIGKDVEVLMVDTESDRFYGTDNPIICCDLVTNREREANASIRIWVTSVGEPKVLGWSVGSDAVRLRDFHPITPTKDLFSTPKI